MNIFKFKPFSHKRFELQIKNSPPKVEEIPLPKVSANLNNNLLILKKVFSSEINDDIKIREFKIGNLNAFILFIENLVDSNILNTNILAPLMLLPKEKTSVSNIMDTLIVHNQVSTSKELSDIATTINMGDCVLFIDKCDTAIVLDVKNWVRRTVQPPVAESVIYGPHEGFNENFKTNIALIRKNVRSQNMICKTLYVGNVSKTPCTVMYMKNIVNPDLLKEIYYRLENLDTDYITQIGELEQYIEDSTYSPFPQMLTTERPDKASNALIEGKIVLLLQGSPFALVLPVTISEFLTSVEDKYIRFPFAALTKGIRLLGIVSSFLLSGLYIAIVNFHREMIPPGLLLAIETTRESVPFSALLELLIMEIAFDIIREASIRVPSPIGSTLGIIGGLIIGQAAVSANIVSPIAIIIVALTGIGSFATPNYSLNFSFRFLRYFYIIAGATSGFFGIGVLIFISASVLCGLKSLGVPLFSSFATNTNQSVLSFLFPKPVYKRDLRHDFLNPRLKKTQSEISRRWDK